MTGANDRISRDDVERARSAIAAAGVLVCQLEIPLEITMAALAIAREEATTTILNPAPAVAGLAPELYELVDILCPSEVETELLVGHELEPGGEAAAELLTRGARSVILTLGERGCLVHTAAESVLLPAERVEARDTTGAGDAFVGSLAYFLARG